VCVVRKLQCVHVLCRMMESADAIDDSDDEVDYTKMDQGNKKGPVGRWDFDTQEEYQLHVHQGGSAQVRTVNYN